MNNVLTINDDNFVAEVLESSEVTVVDFWAEWCGPCQAMTPAYHETAADFAGKAKFVKVNVQENPDTPAKYGIRSIPTILIFKNGEVVSSHNGQKSKQELHEIIDNVI